MRIYRSMQGTYHSPNICPFLGPLVGDSLFSNGVLAFDFLGEGTGDAFAANRFFLTLLSIISLDVSSEEANFNPFSGVVANFSTSSSGNVTLSLSFLSGLLLLLANSLRDFNADGIMPTDGRLGDVWHSFSSREPSGG